MVSNFNTLLIFQLHIKINIIFIIEFNEESIRGSTCPQLTVGLDDTTDDTVEG